MGETLRQFAAVLAGDILGLHDVLLESIERIAAIVAILLLTVLFARVVRRVLSRAFAGTVLMARMDPMQARFLKHAISGAIYLLGISAAVYTIPQLRALSVSVFAGAGVLAVVLGFAAQEAFSNVVSGVFIALFKPFRVDDRVRIGKDISGVVEEVTLRHTVIRTAENNRIVVPNSVISREVIENSNMGDPKVCKSLDFGISYDADADKAIGIIRDEAMKHPHFLDNRTEEQRHHGEPPVQVRVVGVGDSAVTLRAWVWVERSDYAFPLGCDLLKSVKERFDRGGIGMPYPRAVLLREGRKASRRGGSR
ncbi:mechanosensitive ion channel family protein [Candidatus Woesearchaeota archaeon]|nr:mechanosensitive ion channel family protein [Candidatus Woesearchaeota archaeon]